jgi:CheY-like chemotaxis protein
MCKKQILIVDDDKIIIDIFTAVLENFEYCVTSSHSTTAALQYFSKNYNSIGCVITDFHMPKKNGFEFAKEIQSVDVATPIILCTGGYIEEEYNHNIFNVILRKPVGAFDLLSAVQFCYKV